MAWSDDARKAEQQRWLAAHRQAGVWAGIAGLPLVCPVPPLLAAFDAPVLMLLASVPAWLVQRRCARTVLAITGTAAASAVWLLLDAAAWCWLLRGLLLFRISTQLGFQLRGMNLVAGTLLYLGVGAAVGLVQACWAKRGSWRLRWILASALSQASGFVILFGLPQLLLQLLKLGSFSMASQLIYGVLVGLLVLCSCLVWQLRGWITLKLVVSNPPISPWLNEGDGSLPPVAAIAVTDDS